jgi:hypothetical protein
MPRARKAENALDIRRLALIGAQARLAEITAESAKILSAFPELRGSRNGAAASISSASASPRPRRRRTKMSAEARRRIAEAQKRRWSEWRKQNSR